MGIIMLSQKGGVKIKCYDAHNVLKPSRPSMRSEQMEVWKPC